MKTEYVAGFLFDPMSTLVLLVEKLRPDWQAGKWNGIGGHIEQGETPHDAMMREFAEEAGIVINHWHQFALLEGDRFKVHFFSAHDRRIFEAEQKTDERINQWPVFNLPQNCLPNVNWLVPMALHINEDATGWFHVMERAVRDTPEFTHVSLQTA